MTLEIIFDVLKKAQLSDVEVKLSFNESGKAQVMLSFNKDGASVKDSDTVRQLRSALAMPLVLVGESDAIDSLVIEGCGHLCEPISKAVELVSAESLAKKVSSKAAPKAKQANTASKKAKSAAKTEKPSVSTEKKDAKVDEKPSEQPQESPSLDIFSSGFSL